MTNSAPDEFLQTLPERLAGRYRLGERLGVGGMAVVYRAFDETLARDVAIKFMAPARVLSDEYSARFVREARAVARLTHPHIVTLYDVVHEGAYHYLVLEYVPGRDLRAALVERGGALPLDFVVRAARGVLSALGYAHQQGIVHRDVKPQNVLLTADGTAKVADFGLAFTVGDVHLTTEGALIGTALYMAPELVLGGAFDGRADLYALGAVLYELLTGVPPFAGDHALAILSQALAAPVMPPSVLNSRVPPALDALVLKLLAKQPEARYATAEAALADLPDLAAWERVAGEAAPVGSVEGGDESTQELLLYSAVEDAAVAAEEERRRLAEVVESQVAEPLGLLLAQAGLYEQTLSTHPPARMALSVLTSLARQILQQARDLTATLAPNVLEALGLEPALEALAGQVQRAYGTAVAVQVERLRERLPEQVELALLRTAQDVLGQAARGAQAVVRLTRAEMRVTLEVRVSAAGSGVPGRGLERLRMARRRIERLGGAWETQSDAGQAVLVRVTFVLDPPVALTTREQEVLALAAEGLSNKEIALALQITPRTVNFHLDNVYAKLGVNSRTEAALYAWRQGMVKRK